MVNGILEDFLVVPDVVRNEIADVSTRVNLTMQAMANQAPTRGAIQVNRIKILEPKTFYGATDAKAFELHLRPQAILQGNKHSQRRSKNNASNYASC